MPALVRLAARAIPHNTVNTNHNHDRCHRHNSRSLVGSTCYGVILTAPPSLLATRVTAAEVSTRVQQNELRLRPFCQRHAHRLQLLHCSASNAAHPTPSRGRQRELRRRQMRKQQQQQEAARHRAQQQRLETQPTPTKVRGVRTGAIASTCLRSAHGFGGYSGGGPLYSLHFLV